MLAAGVIDSQFERASCSKSNSRAYLVARSAFCMSIIGPQVNTRVDRAKISATFQNGPVLDDGIVRVAIAEPRGRV
jgi:hypothetical protein